MPVSAVTPAPVLKAIVFPAPDTVPPIVLFDPLTRIPTWLPGPAAEPDSPVPTKLLWMTLELVWTLIPAPPNSAMSNPSMVLLSDPIARSRPSNAWPMPLISTNGVPP